MIFPARAEFLDKKLPVLRFQRLSGKARGRWITQSFDYGNFRARAMIALHEEKAMGKAIHFIKNKNKTKLFC